MKNFSKGLFLLAAAASTGLVSCSDESPWRGSDSEGGINLEFSSDARVMRQTRADDSVSPVVPDGNQFAVNLSKSDGSYSKNWSSVEAFNRETSFPMGDYTLTASYGSIDEEGFTNPYYMGQTDVHVSPGAVTDARVVATLANAMVSIRYTDAFRENFSAYSTSIQTEGHQWVVFAQDETRPAYVAPSDVKLDLTLTNHEGKVVHIEPASFVAIARHHYVVTIGVAPGSESGDLVLDIQFDDDVVAETVNVSLGDDLFNAPAPVVKTKGFDSGTALEAFEYAAFKNQAQFDVVAFGGLKSATLNVISSNGYVPSFGRSVQLVNADANTQAQLTAAGIDCAGFFRNVDKMGVVDLRNFVAQLPSGNYTIELQVVDAMPRTTEPVGMSVNITPVELEVSSAVKPAFLATEVSMDVATNCADIRDEITFKAPDANNQLVDATIKSVTALSGASGKATRADLPYKYRYVIEVAKITRTTMNVETTLGKRTFKTAVTVADPDFTVTPDAFARKVVFKIESDSEEANEYICDNLVFYNGETPVPTSNISHTGEGFITITGLQPSTTYSGMNCRLDSYRKDIAEFTTEAETQLPNNTFSELGQQYKFDKIQCGGQWNVPGSSWYVYTNYSNINRYAPASWATLNDLTCYSGTNPKNTWFVVPSTFVENGSVTVRTVGYNHNGTVPAQSAATGKYYCTNSPSASDLSVSAGELFLGSYSFNGSASRTDGVAFASRPSTLTFNYTYTSLNNEKGEVYVKVYAADGTLLAQKTETLDAAASTTSHTLALPSYPFGKKGAKICVDFKSSNASNPAITIPTGSDLNEGISYKLGTKEYYVGGSSSVANAHKTFAKGSELVISNVQLGYDAVSTRAKAAKRR